MEETRAGGDDNGLTTSFDWLMATESSVEGIIGSAKAASREGSGLRGVAVRGARARGSNVGDASSSDPEVVGARIGEIGGE